MNCISPAVPEVPAEVDRYRRLVGFLLGFALGLVYTLEWTETDHDRFISRFPRFQNGFATQNTRSILFTDC